MTDKTKKIIAREGLVIIGCLLVYLVIGPLLNGHFSLSGMFRATFWLYVLYFPVRFIVRAVKKGIDKTVEKKRSKSVTILGNFLLFCVLPGLMAAFIGLISGPTHPIGALERALDGFTRTIFILCPFIFFLLGKGILELKNWARLSAIIFYLILALYLLVILYNSWIMLGPQFEMSNYIPAIAGIIFSICVICFLTRPKIKEQFK